MKKDEQYSILDDKFSKWFEDPGQGYIPTPEVEAKHSEHRIRKRHRRRRYIVNPYKLLEELFFGFLGIVLCGVSFYVIFQFTISIIEGE